jgi:ribonucleotide reductase beta subunit family protein with ferritin-like domain
LTQAQVEVMIKSAVDIEKSFVCDSLPVNLIGMNSLLMSQYIEFVADRLVVALGYKKMYNVTNPFEWMEMISLQGKTNFFEKRVGEYQKAGVMAGRDAENDNFGFSLDVDF